MPNLRPMQNSRLDAIMSAHHSFVATALFLCHRRNQLASGRVLAVLVSPVARWLESELLISTSGPRIEINKIRELSFQVAPSKGVESQRAIELERNTRIPAGSSNTVDRLFTAIV